MERLITWLGSAGKAKSKRGSKEVAAKRVLKAAESKQVARPAETRSALAKSATVMRAKDVAGTKGQLVAVTAQRRQVRLAAHDSAL